MQVSERAGQEILSAGLHSQSLEQPETLCKQPLPSVHNGAGRMYCAHQVTVQVYSRQLLKDPDYIQACQPRTKRYGLKPPLTATLCTYECSPIQPIPYIPYCEGHSRLCTVSYRRRILFRLGVISYVLECCTYTQEHKIGI
jgi:hypothetical protein